MKSRESTALEDVLGHRLAQSELLELALTHSSQAREMEAARAPDRVSDRVSDNEQLEFLGDAVLGFVFFFQAEDGIRDLTVTGVQTCALPIYLRRLASEQVARDHVGQCPPAGQPTHVGQGDIRRGYVRAERGPHE